MRINYHASLLKIEQTAYCPVYVVFLFELMFHHFITVLWILFYLRQLASEEHFLYVGFCPFWHWHYHTSQKFIHTFWTDVFTFTLIFSLGIFFFNQSYACSKFLLHKYFLFNIQLISNSLLILDMGYQTQRLFVRNPSKMIAEKWAL